MWLRREWGISICFHLLMAKADKNAAIAQGPDENCASSPLGMNDFRSEQFSTSPKSILASLSHQVRFCFSEARSKFGPCILIPTLLRHEYDCLQFLLSSQGYVSNSNVHSKQNNSNHKKKWSEQDKSLPLTSVIMCLERKQTCRISPDLVNGNWKVAAVSTQDTDMPGRDAGSDTLRVVIKSSQRLGFEATCNQRSV